MKTLKWILVYPLIIIIDFLIYIAGIFFTEFRGIYIKTLKTGLNAALTAIEQKKGE